VKEENKGSEKKALPGRETGEGQGGTSTIKKKGKLRKGEQHKKRSKKNPAIGLGDRQDRLGGKKSRKGGTKKEVKKIAVRNLTRNRRHFGKGTERKVPSSHEQTPIATSSRKREKRSPSLSPNGPGKGGEIRRRPKEPGFGSKKGSRKKPKSDNSIGGARSQRNGVNNPPSKKESEKKFEGRGKIRRRWDGSRTGGLGIRPRSHRKKERNGGQDQKPLVPNSAALRTRLTPVMN